MAEKKLQIRNSTAEFLIFTKQAGEDTIEVRVQDENIWLTQKLIAKLFEVKIPTINEHLKNIFSSKELDEKSVVRNFLITAGDGKNYQTNHYNLEVIISLGYRINSEEAVNFRKWATRILKDFAVKGYVLDDDRLKNGAYLSPQYFRDLILEIRDIRESERNFYQQITDIYSTAIDYDLHAQTTKEFFAAVQNKLHYSVHGNTAAELIMKRADAKKDHMGLTTMYLDYAEDQAENGIPMTMKDWSEKLNAFLKFNQKDILEDFGKVSAEVARSFAESEFEKYKVIQDRSYISDFDRLVKDTAALKTKKRDYTQ